MTKRGFILSVVVCVGVIVILMVLPARSQESGGATPTLTVNGLDASMPVEIEPDEDIIIAVAGLTEEQKESYWVTCETGGELTALPEPDSSAERPVQGDYLFTFADDQADPAIVSLMTGDILDYQLVLFRVPDANTVIIGVDIQDESIMGQDDKATAFPGLDQTEPNPLLLYGPESSYSDQTIVIEANEFVAYDGNLMLENCLMDVNGCVELNSDVTLINSLIRVKGKLKVRPGITITETGPSSIIATGDSENEGRIIIEGDISNPVSLVSDYSSPDAEFVIIDGNSSVNSSLKCLDFYGGWTNIWIRDKRLIEPVSNCRFFGADYAVWQDGLDELTDIRFSLFYDNSEVSIYLGMDPMTDDETKVWVDNVVIDNNSQDAFGCVITGSEYYWGIFNMSDSIITNSYCGWYLDTSTYVWPILRNVAYYNNDYNDNLVDSSPYQTNPMYLAQSPFETPQSPGDWPYFINPLSPVAEVNLVCDLWQSAPQQLLTSLYSNSAPRANKGIGFGMPILPEYSSHVYSIMGDFNDDGTVDNSDYSTFAKEWKTVKDSATNPPHFPDANGYSVCDFDYDGIVDALDLAEFCGHWLCKGDIKLTTQDATDSLTVVCEHLDGLIVKDYALFLDGKYIGLREPNDNPNLIINKIRYPNGPHSLKAVIRGAGDQPYVTAAETVLFDSPLSDLDFETIFDPANHYFLRAKVADGYTAAAEIRDMDGQVLWSGEYTSDFMASVEPNVFSSGAANYEVAYEYDDQTLAPSGSGSSAILALDGKPVYSTAGLIICMIEDGWKDGASEDDTGTCRFADRKMRQKNIKTVVLRGFGANNQVTYECIMAAQRKYPNIRFLHINTHGNWECDGAGWLGLDTTRTIVQFNDGIWPSYNSRRWTDAGYDVPEDYEYLADNLEEHYALAHIVFDYDQIRMLVIESCYGLRNVATLDFSNALIEYVEGAFEYEDGQNPPLNWHPEYPFSDVTHVFNMRSEDQVAIGSASAVIKSWYTYYARFFNGLYARMADGMNFRDAYTDLVLYGTSSAEVLRYHRVRGLGLSALSDIRLSSNP